MAACRRDHRHVVGVAAPPRRRGRTAGTDVAGSPIARLRIGDGRWTDFGPQRTCPPTRPRRGARLGAWQLARPEPNNTSLPDRLPSPSSSTSRADRIGRTTSDHEPVAGDPHVGLARRTHRWVGCGRALNIDLRRDGPHALIAGTTGSGKSELLRTMVAALAAHHPPDQLTFLFVDYKGGAAFRRWAPFRTRSAWSPT